MPLAQLSAGFQSLPLLPTSKLSPSGAGSQVGGFVCILGPCGSLQWTLLWGWEFLLLPKLPQVFSVRGFEALFPCAGTLGCVVWLAPQLFLPFYPHANVGLPSPPTAASTALVLQPPPCHESSPLQLPISATTPSLDDCVFFNSWLLNFHTFQFSGKSGYFLCLNLLFFWLCKEAERIYLCLHLGQKSNFFDNVNNNINIRFLICWL